MSWLDDIVGKPGDTGVIIAAYYTDGKRRLMCMADHETKGIWLTNTEEFPSTKAGEEDQRKNWYGTRAEFDAAGWQLTT